MVNPFDDLPPFAAENMTSQLSMGPADTAFKAMSGVDSYHKLFGNLIPGGAGGAQPPYRPAIVAGIKKVGMRRFRLDTDKACDDCAALIKYLEEGIVGQRVAVIRNDMGFSPEQAVHIALFEWIEYELRKDAGPVLEKGKHDMRKDLPPLATKPRVARPKRPRARKGSHANPRRR